LDLTKGVRRDVLDGGWAHIKVSQKRQFKRIETLPVGASNNQDGLWDSRGLEGAGMEECE